MTKRKSKNYRFYVIPAVLLAIAGGVFLLEKNNVINLYSNDIQETTAPQATVNDINYDPATTTDNEDINARKDNGTVDATPVIPTNDTSIQITFIANAQDVSGGQLEIRTLLNGVNDGSCALTLSKGPSEIKKSSTITKQNNYFICDAFIIPYTELTNGEWNIILRVTAGDGRTNEASTTTTIN